MPNPPRYTCARAIHYVTLRCNSREFLFTPAAHLQEARDRFPLALAASEGRDDMSSCNLCYTSHLHVSGVTGTVAPLRRYQNAFWGFPFVVPIPVLPVPLWTIHRTSSVIEDENPFEGSSPLRAPAPKLTP